MIFARYQIPTASTGDMLRGEMARRTPLGIEANVLTRQGNLVPDEVIIAVVRGWLEGHLDGFVFDGFPRTTGQAESLDQLLQSQECEVDVAISLEAPTEILRQRIRNRMVCSQCREIFACGWQIEEGDQECPFCGGSLQRREDDSIAVFEKRMVEYADKTAALIGFYENRSLLFRIDAARRAEEVFADLQATLEHP